MMMFLGECTQKNHFAQKQTKQLEKKQNFSLFSLFFFLSSPLFFSLFSLVSSQQKTSSTFLVALLVFILSARRTSHLSEFTQFRRAHASSRSETKILSVVLRSFNTIKSVLREKRERRERVVCGYSCVHHFDWSKKARTGD